MHRLTACTGLALFALSSGGERIEVVYREGVETACTCKESLRITTDEASFTLNGIDEALDEDEMEPSVSSVETTLRIRDRVLEADDGRPIRLRGEFDELREKLDVDGEETEKTGPLEGRALLLQDEGGEVKVELE